MLVQAQILGATVGPHIKKDSGEAQEKCEVALRFDHPSELVIGTLWANSIKAGEHLPFQALVGKTVILSGKYEVFNKSLQFRLFGGFKPYEVPQVTSAPAAGKK